MRAVCEFGGDCTSLLLSLTCSAVKNIEERSGSFSNSLSFRPTHGAYLQSQGEEREEMKTMKGKYVRLYLYQVSQGIT